MLKVLKEVETDFKSVIKKGGFSVTFPASIDPSIFATDQKIIKRIITILLENALIFNRPKGVVKIDAGIDNKGLNLSVKDSGIGITEEQQPSIFTKFFRGSNYDTTDIPGAGLGLCICQEYVKLLRGTIWFESEPGKGTTFFVQLPKGK
jgi:signal transduction histidine kinase